MANLGVQGQHSQSLVQDAGVKLGDGISEEQRQILMSEAESELLTERDIKDAKFKQSKADEVKALQKTQATAFADRDHDVRDLLKSMSEKVAKKESGKIMLMDMKIEQEMKEVIQEMAEQATIGEEASIMKDKAREQGAQEHKSSQLRREMGIREQSLKDAFKKLPSHNEEQEATKHLKFRKKVQKTPQPLPTPTAKETQEALTKYLSNFSEGILRDNKAKKDQARQTRDSLLTKGISPRQITGLETTVRQVIRQDLKRKLKDNFIKLAMSYDSKKLSQDMMVHSDAFSQIADQAGLRGVFGSGRNSLKGIKDEAKEELKFVVTDSLDSAIMETKVNGGSAEDLVKAFNKLNDMADIARFNPSEYMKHLNQKINDWGLSDFTRPDVLGVLDTDMSSGSDQSDQQQKEKTPQTELEFLEDDIRALYVQRAVKGTFKSYISSGLSLRKLVRKMKQAGVYSEEKLDDLRQEGESFAKFRLFDLVKESLEERATLPELKGPAFRLVQQKYKHAMKRLKALGSPISTREVRAMRNQINEDMFGIIREEFLRVESRLETLKTDVYLIKKHKELLGILKRLKKESKLAVPIRPEGQRAIVSLGENSIVESA